MIRVSNSPVKLQFVEGHNDMSHYTASHWTTTDWYYMTSEDYKDKYEFEYFDMKPKLSPEQVNHLSDVMSNGGTIDPKICPWADVMDQLIKKAGGHLLWQYNATHKNGVDYVRQVAVLGEERIRIVTRFDCYIKLPVLQFVCNILNKARRHKVAKEYTEWDTFLESVPRKTGE